MGIDPNSLNERQRQCIDPADRRRVGIETYAKSHERMVRTLEREEQRTFAAWLSLREADGVLVYDWSRTDRRTTNRKGLPDFRIFIQGRVLLAEMKVGAGKLSADQEVMIQKFARSGTEVQLWHSAAEAIEGTRDWLGSL